MVFKHNLRKPSERKAPDRYSPDPAALQRKVNAAYRASQKRAMKQASEIKSISKKSPNPKRTQGGRVTKTLPKKGGIQASKVLPTTKLGAAVEPANKKNAAKGAAKEPIPAAKVAPKKAPPVAKVAPKKQAPAARLASKKQSAAAKPTAKVKSNIKAAATTSNPDINKTKGGRVTKPKISPSKPTAKRKARTVSSTSNDSDIPLAKATKRKPVARQSTTDRPSSGSTHSGSAGYHSPSALAVTYRGLAVGQSVARSVVQSGQAVIGAAVEAAVSVVPSASQKINQK